ncbi:hypothetical protein AAHE18_01G240000 [Arachis hypogaea]
METQWAFLHVLELNSYVIFIPIVERSFRNPYNLFREAYSALRVHLNTFKLLEEKNIPSIIDKFGWCTWDAFYLSVEPVGVFHGLKDFTKIGGVSPRFVIIDDG